VYGQKARIAALFALGAFLLLVFTRPSLFSAPRIAMVDCARPALKTLKGLSSFARRLIPFASYRDRIRRLTDRINAMSQEMARVRSLQLENERLRNLLVFKKQLPFQTIPAQVVGRDPSNWSNSVIIDKGRAHAVVPTMAVISPRGLVGRVIESGRSSSKVLLITDPSSKVGAILDRERQGGVVVGRPGGSCRMIYISLETEVAVGEKVFTAGYGAVFPKGILIGEVVSSGKEPGRLYRFAILKPSQDLSRLEEVLCIR